MWLLLLAETAIIILTAFLLLLLLLLLLLNIPPPSSRVNSGLLRTQRCSVQLSPRTQLQRRKLEKQKRKEMKRKLKESEEAGAGPTESEKDQLDDVEGEPTEKDAHDFDKSFWEIQHQEVHGSGKGLRCGRSGILALIVIWGCGCQLWGRSDTLCWFQSVLCTRNPRKRPGKELCDSVFWIHSTIRSCAFAVPSLRFRRLRRKEKRRGNVRRMQTSAPKHRAKKQRSEGSEARDAPRTHGGFGVPVLLGPERQTAASVMRRMLRSGRHSRTSPRRLPASSVCGRYVRQVLFVQNADRKCCYGIE